MKKLTREEVIAKVAEAREDGKNPDLSGLDLSGIYLSWVDLSEANLRHADLRHVNLSNTNLSNTNLSHANLDHVDLSHANLDHANLSGADLSYANLNSAISPATDKFLQTPFGWAHIRTDYIRIGCQYHSVKKWRGFTDDEISGMSNGALDWWRENKDIIFFIVDKLKGMK